MVTDMNNQMPAGLIWTFRIIDWGMILYWSIIGLNTLGFLALPRAFMYDGYGTAIIDAWNWSFAPLDILFAILGLMAINYANKNDARWHGLAITSLSLTFCAGLMAIGFWAIRGEFNPAWWIPNMLLMIIPAFWLWKLLMITSATEPDRG